MIRAVIDTNILVSAMMNHDQSPRMIMRQCLEGKIQALMGTTLYLECEDVTHREYIFKRCSITQPEREALFDAFLASTEWVNIFYNWRPNLKDEADNHLID